MEDIAPYFFYSEQIMGCERDTKGTRNAIGMLKGHNRDVKGTLKGYFSTLKGY